MASALTRRGLVKAAPAAVVAIAAPFSAVDANDAELLALRPVWIAKRAEFEDALNALSAAEKRCDELQPALPDIADFEGRYADYLSEHRRIINIRDAIEVESGLAAAREAEDRTLEADSEMVDRILALPARTNEGIRFKREVLADWNGCLREDLTQSLLNDLLVMGGFDA